MPIIRVELDALADVAIDGAAAGQRVWVEVGRRGQVVGIVEGTIEAGGLSALALEKLTRSLSSIPVPSRVPIPDDQLPRASVVVPTICRDPSRLVSTIETVLALDYPDFDVLVVDNRRNAHGVPMPQFPGGTKVKVLTELRPGVAAARNCGIDQATGDIVAFTDDDVVVDVNWLRELGTRFAISPEVDGISGLVLPMELRTRPQLWFEEFFGGFNQSFSTEIMSMELLAPTDRMFPYATGRFGAGCNMAFRKAALVKDGGFDVRLGTGSPARGGEDLKIFMKQVLNGGTVAFEPRAVVSHQHRESEKAFLNQAFSYGVGLSAMFTELIIRDPRHLFKLIRRIPGGYQILSKPRDERSPSLAPSYPLRTYLYHVLGLLYGPFAYLQSALRSGPKG